LSSVADQEADGEQRHQRRSEQTVRSPKLQPDVWQEEVH